MKKVSLFTLIILIILISLNIFSFFNVNNRFITFLNNSLNKQVSQCGNYMETELTQFENDLNKLLFEYNFSKIFRDRIELDKSNQELQIFYSKYRDLVTNVFIYDNNKNYYGLYLNDKDNFVIDTFSRQRQQDLYPRDKVEKNGNKFLYYYPYFESDKVIGNIMVEVDFNKFAKSIFSFYPQGKTISWKWVLSANGELFFNNFDEQVKIGSIMEIADSINIFAAGIIKHAITDTSGYLEKVYSAYYPLSILNQNLGIVFSVSKRDFNSFFIYHNLYVPLITFLLSFALIIYLLIRLKKGTKREKNFLLAETVFRQIIENLPFGIIILDSENVIKNINSAAQNMLFADKKQDMIGKEFSNQLLLSNKYLLQDHADTIYNQDYLYYEKDGIETVIYRLQENARIGGENLILVGLIDVSAIERSRKQEVAANRTKSDFITSMSLEIRTPMNGILGMVKSLLDSELPQEEKEKIRQIKKSSDLLMTIITDILDLSKIEAGKMILEEISFNLREEISIGMNLFSSPAKEKGLSLETNIGNNVPDKLIGDPFRLRQVISNLLSNAIKFTEKGKIVVGADIMEIENYSLQLLFWVEDTGVGIPKDKIKNIFTNYTQISDSTSKKYGGTGLGLAISKQLVELMNGELWVESPSGISTSNHYPGSKFSFTITVYSNEPLKKNIDLSGINKLHQITALLLTKDSKPENINVLRLLNAFGINMVTKIYQDSTVEAVTHHIKTKKDLYKLIVIAEGDVDGFAMANKLKSEGLMNKYPVILVSSNDQRGNYKISRKLMIDYYLVEPVESKELFEIINQIFKGLTDQNSITPILNSLPVNLKILVADDNPINIKVAQSIFKNIGYEIDVVSNGREAFDIVQQTKYDIIFMDLFMPEMDGFEATGALRDKGCNVQIIGVSADNSTDRKSEASKAGMDDFITKPIKMDTIKNILIEKFSTSF